MTFETRGVLYVCSPEEHLAAAGDAGVHMARLRGVSLVEKVTDPFGEPNPAQRDGWKHLVELAEGDGFIFLITYLPTSISPDVVRRYQAIRGLAKLGARPLYSWPGQGPSTRHEAVAL